ncbi:MAG: hypothetical protein JXB47_07570, partial [Anaerolineae bacterium]|nr:hypothetical protein [Anaerolineae bacterium]
LRAPVAVVVRSGPGMDYPQVDTLRAGQDAYIRDRAYDADVQGEWLMIGEDRWVAGWVVETADVGAGAGEAVSTGDAEGGAPLRPDELRAPVAVVVRSGPGMVYAEVDVLAAGARAQILDRFYDADIDAEWLRIGEDRWVAGWIVETGDAGNDAPPAGVTAAPTEAPLAPGTLKAATAAIVRSGPGANYPQVGLLRAGERAVIDGRSLDGFWLRIGEGRWVGASVVIVGGDIEAIPVVETPAPPD